MKCFCYLGILREGFSPYSSPVMLISRKMTQHKRVVTDFRHLNVRIVKNNLAYPLVRDTFSVFGNSKCKVFSVLDLKDAFYSLRLLEDLKRYCSISQYFGSVSYIYQRMPMGLNISPSIWQSCINTILEYLQSRKHCEAIMDDLLLFTPSKREHIAKLEDPLKALLKNGLQCYVGQYEVKSLKFSLSSFSCLGVNYCIYSVYCDTQLLISRFSFLRIT